MLKPYIAKLVERQDLSEKESEEAMSLIMSGKATEAQVAGFLVALRMKGETVAEITGFARAMRAAATRINVQGLDLVDTCGTGGDRKGTFNVSTAAALVAAGAGVPVAKHGNRSVSSGSADVLRTLGVNIEVSPEVVEECIRQVGMGFLFAPALHKAMKFAIGPRREMGVRTVFNILGPLTNPAGARRQLLGLFSGDLLETIAGVLLNLGAEKAMVVHGADGLDELSVCAESSIAEIDGGAIRTWRLTPESVGLPRAQLTDLVVDGPEESAEVIRFVLSGGQGPRRDITLLNAGAAVYVGGRAASLEEGMQAAAETIDTGRAQHVLEGLVELTNR
jgi:anthranilate phosphoribosyltransferase